MSADIEDGDIVQLDPMTTKNRAFAGCLMTVTAVHPWGVQGYVQALGNSPTEEGGQAYYRAENGSFERCGRTVWRAS
jgi:hypothetical protein